MKIFNDNNCGWIDYSNRRTDIKKLEKDLSCDCLIVGAGFTGLSAARKLGQIRKNITKRKIDNPITVFSNFKYLLNI